MSSSSGVRRLAATRGKSGGKPPHSKALPLVLLKNCSIVLDGKRVLDDVTFNLRAGERWALVGPNGSGKTLLLKLLRGDMWPTPQLGNEGYERREYCFDGEVSEQPFGAKERIAYVGPERQDKYVRYEWNHSVAQVVATGLFNEDIPRATPTSSQRQRVSRLLKRFGLWSLRRRGFLTLSYGQRRRTLVARAFAGEPQVLLLDEVFNGLDASSAHILRKALQRKRGAGSTWIVTTHRAHDVPPNATHVARMEKGSVVYLGSMARHFVPSLAIAGEGQDGGFENATQIASPHPNSAPLSRGGDKKEWLIQLRHVNLYRDYRLVLRDVNWTIRRGEHWAIMGRNGSGKSTLLKLLYGDLHPKLGGIIERDSVPLGTPIAEWKQRLGYVSPELQADYFLARDLEEIAISGRYASIGLNHAATAADRKAARRWLEFFGLLPLAHRKPREVSYGQLRLALIARAMMNDPELLLLDEPCTGLDVDVRAQVLSLLERLAVSGTQLAMAVHDRRDLPRAVTRLLRLRGKRVSVHYIGHYTGNSAS